MVALLFTGIAISAAPFMAPSLVAGTALAIALVGAVYVSLLRGLVELSSGDAIANVLLHWVIPVLVPLFWFAFIPKGTLRRSDPLGWALYPLAYRIYGLVRGAIDGRYAYPFMDVARLGWWQAGLKAVAMGFGFLLTGYALVVLDRRMGAREQV